MVVETARSLVLIALTAGLARALAPSFESLKTAPLPAISIAPAVPRALGRKTVSGVVVFVPDGDTIHFDSGGELMKLRMEGIDAPERSQPFGEAAGETLRRTILDKRITVRVTTEDAYGRLVGTAFDENGTDLNAAMVAAGLAWWYRYFSNAARLEKLETEARAFRRGLWAQENPEAPWNYRRRTRRPGSFETEDPLEGPDSDRLIRSASEPTKP